DEPVDGLDRDPQTEHDQRRPADYANKKAEDDDDEHGCARKKQEVRDRGRKLAGHRAGAHHPAWHHAETADGRFRPPQVSTPDRRLVEEDQDVQRDEADGDEWDTAAGYVVPERNHRGGV